MVNVLASDKRFISLRWHRRARKTTLGLNWLIRECCLHQNRIMAYIGPTYKQAHSIVVKDPMMLTRYLPPEVLAKPFNESSLTAHFKTGSVLMIKGADDPDSLRGIGFYKVFLDEWALQKREIFDEILMSVLAENHGGAMFGFTPKGRNHAYDFWRRGGLAEYPDWASFDLLASESGLIAPEELASARQAMGDELYKQEMLCEFLDSLQSVFRGIESCVRGRAGEHQAPQEGRQYVMGVDLGKSHDATVLSVLDCATRHLVYWERLTNNHWALQKRMIAAASYRYNHCPVVIDATGFSAGDPIAEDLQQLGISVEPFKFGHVSKNALVDGLRVAIAQRLVSFPAHDHLLTELRDFQITVSERGTIFYGAPEGEGYFDDCVMSLALAVHGLGADLYVQTSEVADEYAYAVESESPNRGYGFGA